MTEEFCSREVLLSMSFCQIVECEFRGLADLFPCQPWVVQTVRENCLCTMYGQR